MSNHNRKQRNLLKTFLYIIIIIVLLGCLGYIVYYSRLQRQERQDKAQEIIEQENEELISDEEDISQEEATPTPKKSKKKKTATPTEKPEDEETATPTPAPEASEAEVSVTPVPETSEAGTSATPAPETAKEEPAVTPTPEAADASSGVVASAEPESAGTSGQADKDKDILVLNGTKIPGVATYWKSQLEAGGYTAVTPATYNLAIEEQTVIYTKDSAVGEALKLQFPNAVIRDGTVVSGIEAMEGFPVPENCEAYVIIGRLDARNS
ncbi:MAG: LytR C-terminal domain-containing protein [Eubacteriales bacterium]|nr:LytR C-terminal domain-containing protein [Eubacteriales bacterium]